MSGQLTAPVVFQRSARHVCDIFFCRRSIFALREAAVSSHRETLCARGIWPGGLSRGGNNGRRRRTRQRRSRRRRERRSEVRLTGLSAKRSSHKQPEPTHVFCENKHWKVWDYFYCVGRCLSAGRLERSSRLRGAAATCNNTEHRVGLLEQYETLPRCVKS